MKAFLHKFKLGSRKDKDEGANKNKNPQPGPLPDLLPAPLISATPTSVGTSQPLSDLSSGQLSSIDHLTPLKSTESSTAGSTTPALKPAEPNGVPSTQTPVPQPQGPTPSRSDSNATKDVTAAIITVDAHKNATSMSPLTTPAIEHPLRPPTPANDLPPPSQKMPSYRSGRISTTRPPHSGTDLSTKPGEPSIVQATTTLPYRNEVSTNSAPAHWTAWSTTPYSRSHHSPTMCSTWTKWADVDLVANLGSQERARQEALLEIVSSEERSDNPSQPLL